MDSPTQITAFVEYMNSRHVSKSTVSESLITGTPNVSNSRYISDSSVSDSLTTGTPDTGHSKVITFEGCDSFTHKPPAFHAGLNLIKRAVVVRPTYKHRRCIYDPKRPYDLKQPQKLGYRIHQIESNKVVVSKMYPKTKSENLP